MTEISGSLWPQRLGAAPYLPELHLMAETELTSAPHPVIDDEYIWFDGMPVAQQSSTGEIRWTFTDHLGTPLLQTSSLQGIVWRAEYEPYGRIFELRAQDVHQPLRLPGQEAEQLNAGANGATDRSYNIHRWYESGLGRYAEPDPLDAVSRGGNAFWYSGSQPLTDIDPLGNAYFARRPLHHVIWLGPFSCNPVDDWAGTAISHEQLFFEDGLSPSNLGFFSDHGGSVHPDPHPQGYRCRTHHFSDCIMRMAVKETPTKPYCLLGKPGPIGSFLLVDKFNCQDWANAVTSTYERLKKDPRVQKKCGCGQQGGW